MLYFSLSTCTCLTLNYTNVKDTFLCLQESFTECILHHHWIIMQMRCKFFQLHLYKWLQSNEQAISRVKIKLQLEILTMESPCNADMTSSNIKKMLTVTLSWAKTSVRQKACSWFYPLSSIMRVLTFLYSTFRGEIEHKLQFSCQFLPSTFLKWNNISPTRTAVLLLNGCPW